MTEQFVDEIYNLLDIFEEMHTTPGNPYDIENYNWLLYKVSMEYFFIMNDFKIMDKKYFIYLIEEAEENNNLENLVIPTIKYTNEEKIKVIDAYYDIFMKFLCRGSYANHLFDQTDMIFKTSIFDYKYIKNLPFEWDNKKNVIELFKLFKFRGNFKPEKIKTLKIPDYVKIYLYKMYNVYFR